MMNNIDEKAIIEWVGYRYGVYDYVSSLSQELNTVVTGWLSPEAKSEPYKGKDFSTEPPNIYSLDWQAEKDSLWDRLESKGSLCVGQIITQARAKKEDPATAVLLAVMELIK